jgi:hypothetical protein
MNDNRCYIGLILNNGNMYNHSLVTKDEITIIFEYINLQRPIYGLRPLTIDKLKNIIFKFNYCPICGNKINWDEIESELDIKLNKEKVYGN